MVVAATLVAVTTVLLGTYGIISYRLDAKTQRDSLKKLTNLQANELAVALALPIWNVDRAQIDKVIEAMTRPKSVSGISVHTAGEDVGRLRNSDGNFRPWDGKSAPADMLVEERPINFGDKQIGTVRLLVSRKYLYEDLRTSLVRIVVMIVVVDLLLVLGTYFVLLRVVVRPLKEIEKYAVAVSTGVVPQNAPRPGSLFTADLENLSSSIATMVLQLEQRYTELKEQEDFTNTAINTMTGIFFIQDREGRFIRWNDNMARVADGEQLLSERVGRPMVHPDDREMIEEKVAEIFETGHAEVETRMVLKAGIRNYLFNARRMYVRGQPFMVATGVDITERRQAEAEQRRLQSEIARSAAEWQETFDTVTTPILITEENGTIVRVNRAALELSHLSEDEIKGKPIATFSDGEPWHTAGQLISYIATEHQGTSAETKDAEGRTWDIVVSHFSAPNGGGERFILVLWEITGIVELQESLRRSETVAAMGNLVAGVAHEVRNPLFGISATLDAYQDEMSRPGYVEFAATLRQEVNRLIHLMKELLEYGKPGALSIERGHIRDVVGNAVESRQQAARAAHVRVVSQMTNGIPTLLMDSSRLRQVFENLIDNAIQHSERGSKVQISSAIVEHAGRHWVECRVDDEGAGFAVENLDRVFEPFFTMRDGGTGLGLSIVQRIVEEHSGKVFAANRPEGGGSIRVLFPLAGNGTAAKSVAS
jgi:PAS domain S-box-containing protein